MPLVILILAIVAIAVALKSNIFSLQPSDQTFEVPVDPLKSEIQRSMENVTNQLVPQGTQTLSTLQQEQIKKWSSIATIAGTATALGVASVSSLTVAAAGPIGAAVAGVIVAISILRGTAHLVANQWTSTVQKQFDELLGQIIDAKDAAVANGQASKAMLSQVKITLQTLWNRYTDAAEQFAQQDADHRLVIDQSYCWYVGTRCPSGKSPDPRFPQGFLYRLIQDIDKQIAAAPK